MGYTLNFAVVWRNFDLLLSGLGLSLVLALLAIALGCVIGLIIGAAMIARRRLWRWPALFYVTVLRNTPLLVLVLFTFFALPGLGLRLDKVQSFVLTLAVYAGAYLAEVFRAGLLSVPRGLGEAGLAIGLSRGQIARAITLPLMLRNVLPALGNSFISLFKDSSLAAAIAVPELTYYARKINGESFRVIETWVITSLLYVLACTVIAALLRLVERRLRLPR